MEYLYEIDAYTATRQVKASYVPADTSDANDFQPVTFAAEDLLAETYHMFLTSQLDILVCLFTGEDPAKLLHTAWEQCDHDTQESCDCAPASIQIPPILAFHAQALEQKLDYLSSDFSQWTNKNTSRQIYRYRLPSGELKTTSRSSEPSDPGPEWEQASFYEQQARRHILELWYQQGIALYQSSKPPHHR